jgi:multidrug resistance efflux pump
VTEQAPDTSASARAAARRRLVPVALVLAAALLYTGYRVYQWRRPYEWSGTVEARDIQVGSRVGGRVKEVLVREGERVKAGQPLVVLEPGDLEAQRMIAEGQLRQAQANLDKLRRGARPEEIAAAQARAATAGAALKQTQTGARREQIDAAAARLAAQEVAVDKAQRDAERVRALAESGAASRVDRDNAETALRSAMAQKDALKQAVDELRAGARAEELAQAAARAAEAQATAKLVQAGSRIEDIQAAEALVLAAEGKLEQVKTLLAELTILAPRDARVESLDLRPGDLLSPNATAAVLVEDDELFVRIYVPETQIGHVKVGQTVPVTVDSFPGRSFAAMIAHVNSVGEYSPRNLQTADERADQVFAARVVLKEGRDQLRAGMAAFIRVPK